MRLLTILFFAIIIASGLNAQDNQWVACNNGLGNRTVYCIAIQPNNPAVLVAGTSQGLYRSTNGGQQWTQIHNATARAVWISPDGQTIMFAFSQGSRSDGIWISRNAGQEFNVLSWMLWPYALAVNPDNFNQVFVGTRDQGFRYTIDGQNWNQANNGLPEGTIYHMSVKNLNNQTHLFATTIRGVYHCVVSNNIQWSSIGPRNLPAAQTALGFEGAQDIFAGTNHESDSDGLYFSNNFGQNWNICRWCWWVQAVEAIPGMVMFASREIGVMRSTDNGRNWVLMNQQIPNFDILDLALCRTNNAIIAYGAYNGSGVYSYRIPIEAQVPSPFDLEEPEDEVEVLVGEVTFRWGISRDPDGAVSYTHWLKKGNDSLSNRTNENSIVLNLSQIDWNFQRGDTIQWWVTAEQGGDITECNRRFVFYPYTQPPRNFRLLEPADGDTVENGTILFRWEPSIDPDGQPNYIWSLNRLNEPPQTAIIDTTIYTADLTNLQPGETVFWNVKAFSQGDTILCERQYQIHIKLRQMPPEAFNLLYPPNDTAINVENDPIIRLVWEVSGDPNPEDTVIYHLYLDEVGFNSYQFIILDTCFTFDAREYLSAGGCVVSHVYWYVVAVSGADSTECNERFHFSAYGSGYAEPDYNLFPNKYALLSTYPNPFNSNINLIIELPLPNIVSLEIVDLCGTSVSCLCKNTLLDVGKHRYEWDAKDFPSGVYQARLSIGKTIVVKNITLLK